MTDLFEQANANPELKRELLHNPGEVGKKFGVEFNEEDIMHLQNLGALADLADEVKFGHLYPPGPIFYPIHIWQIQELVDIFTQLLPGSTFKFPHPGPIFYPAESGSQGVAFAATAFNPGWVSYRGEDPGGGGGTISGWKIPGPIFYPAKLRNFMMERLAQILQVKQQR